MEKLTKRERGVLAWSRVHYQKICYEGNGNAYWEGDHLAPFRAHASLATLVQKGLMVQVMDGRFGGFARATKEADNYICVAPNCQGGSIYQNDGSYDIEIGKCQICKGTGLTMTPRRPT